MPALETPTPGLVAALRAAVSQLAITSFTNAGSATRTLEVGQSASGFALAWTLNKPVNTQAVEGVGAIAPGTTTANIPGPITTTTTWSLSVGDGVDSDTRQTSLLFQRRRHAGAVAAAPANSAAILALAQSAFDTNKVVSAGELTVANPAGQKICVAWPASFGDPTTVRMRGFVTTDYTLTTVSHTNASGDTTNYRVLTTNNVLAAGDVSVEIS